MHGVSLFELASQQAHWVSARQKAVATNIANVNTQGFTPVGVAPFKEVLNQSANKMSVTDPRHISIGGGPEQFKVTERTEDAGSNTAPKVSVEEQLIEAGSVRRTYEMNTAIVKAFHRMILMTSRGS